MKLRSQYMKDGWDFSLLLLIDAIGTINFLQKPLCKSITRALIISYTHA